MIRKILRWLLAAVFLMSGTNKVTDRLHADTHNFLAGDAHNWGKVRNLPTWSPFAHSLIV